MIINLDFKGNMYTLIIDYFATGEGRHVWIARVGALNKEDAKDKFRKAFVTFANDKAAWDYYSIGLDIYDDNIKEERKVAKQQIKNLLKNYFTDSLLKSHIDFSMSFHYNFS